jgi:hypothetical protein
MSGEMGSWSTGNGGDGGDAHSGDAFAFGPGASAYSGPGGDASGGSVDVTDGRYDKHWKRGKHLSMNAETAADNPLRDGGHGSDSGPAAYSGAGGNAAGGNVYGEDGFIDLFSGNVSYISSPDHA